MFRHGSTDRMTSQPPRAQDGWAYFLDVDGTLIPHCKVVEDAQPTLRLLALLRTLTQNSPVALISGRRVCDLQALFPDLPLTLVGQNGLEGLMTDGRSWRQRTFSTPLQMGLRTRLLALQNIYPHMGIEDKGLMLTLHCSLIPIHYKNTNLPARLRALIRKCLQLAPQTLTLGWGKTGVDVMPGRFGKGQAVSWLLCDSPFSGKRPVFIGDDWADESAFLEVIQRHGIGVKVGSGQTAARYRLESEQEVHRWLESR